MLTVDGEKLSSVSITRSLLFPRFRVQLRLISTRLSPPMDAVSEGPSSTRMNDANVYDTKTATKSFHLSAFGASSQSGCLKSMSCIKSGARRVSSELLEKPT